MLLLSDPKDTVNSIIMMIDVVIKTGYESPSTYARLKNQRFVCFTPDCYFSFFFFYCSMNTGTCINANNSKRTVMVFISVALIDFSLKMVKVFSDDCRKWNLPAHDNCRIVMASSQKVL